MKNSTIHIKGQKYRVKYKNLPSECDYVAYCDKIKKEIIIDCNANEKERVGALMHEIGHALLYEVCIDSCSGVMPLEIEECVVENYARLMIKLFVSNE